MKIGLTKNRSAQNGFTLIELLVVIGILAILLAITLIAINPTKHFQSTRNTQRTSNVGEILNAVYEYETANNGNLPPSVANVTSVMPLGKAVTQVATGTSFLTPNLTYTVPSGNTVTSGQVLVTGCNQAGDNGTFTVGSGTLTTIVVNDASGSATSATGCTIKTAVDICPDVSPNQIADLPTDPTSGSTTGGATPCNGSTTAYTTGYTITLSNNRFTITAPSAEAGQTISVTR
jgi:prepilin-type N-terminal cleavage/methylation domain-containing protein